jgi:hypothetical protein
MTRAWIFAYNIFAIIVLVAVAVWYVSGIAADGKSISHAPDIFDRLFTLFPLAVRCAWFGALGGVVISLKGVYDHSTAGIDGWQHRYDLWHLGRPVSGAITGLITYVLLSAINPAGEPSQPILYAAAFILGTQESRFFNFLYEVARIIVQVPKEQEPTGLRVTEIQPPEGKADEVLVVRGQGFVPGIIVKLGNVPLAKISVSSDGAAVAGIIPAGASGQADLVVANPDGATVVLHNKFTYRP